jgi:hypothetical protein
MNEPQGWNTAEAFTGDFETLPLGGHVCIIKGARIEQTASGSEMLVVAFDINDGNKYDGYFKRQHEHKKQSAPDAKWPNGGTYRQFTKNKDGTTNSFFKGMITCIEKSNANFKFNFDEKTLTGKLFGGVFGREQFESDDGLKWATKCVSIRSTETINKGVEIPADKLVKGATQPQGLPEGYTEISGDNDLPF